MCFSGNKGESESPTRLSKACLLAHNSSKFGTDIGISTLIGLT